MPDRLRHAFVDAFLRHWFPERAAEGHSGYANWTDPAKRRLRQRFGRAFHAALEETPGGIFLREERGHE